MILLLKCSSLLFLVCTLLLPFILTLVVLKSLSRFRFIAYLLLSLSLGGTVLTTSIWWDDTCTQLQIEAYGYDLDSMTDKDRFAKVAPENIQTVERLMISHMGVGWPVKVIFAYPLYMVYHMGIFCFGWLIRKVYQPSQESRLLPLV